MIIDQVKASEKRARGDRDGASGPSPTISEEIIKSNHLSLRMVWPSLLVGMGYNRGINIILPLSRLLLCWAFQFDLDKWIHQIDFLKVRSIACYEKRKGCASEIIGADKLAYSCTVSKLQSKSSLTNPSWFAIRCRPGVMHATYRTFPAWLLD